jgi:hypothetical protein
VALTFMCAKIISSRILLAASMGERKGSLQYSFNKGPIASKMGLSFLPDASTFSSWDSRSSIFPFRTSNRAILERGATSVSTKYLNRKEGLYFQPSTVQKTYRPCWIVDLERFTKEIRRRWTEVEGGRGLLATLYVCRP